MEDDDDGPAVDPDRASHRRPALVALVLAGGVVGTATREGLTLASGSTSGFPLVVFLINVSGAFLLGVLLESLARRGPDAGIRLLLRLGLGTGFCGGFTTYSSLAAAAAALLASGDVATALTYASATLVVGAGATWLGLLVGTRFGRATP